MKMKQERRSFFKNLGLGAVATGVVVATPKAIAKSSKKKTFVPIKNNRIKLNSNPLSVTRSNNS